ncbi:hypothetical protein RhiirC2_126459 [Rhizophagus irregularis]|uniref:Uncharacterized protein n=1 Tax=Rhizophagus irregularis TaxID=588596 RepID=A0A2N1MQ94_9GLOM|nr:hypothetical protein RhiirC2_126459 [Rhizophagus irregularis]
MKLEKLFDLIIMIIFFLSWLKSNLPNNEVTRISEILSYGNFLFSLIHLIISSQKIEYLWLYCWQHQFLCFCVCFVIYLLLVVRPFRSVFWRFTRSKINFIIINLFPLFLCVCICSAAGFNTSHNNISADKNWLIIFINFNVKFIIFGLLRRCVQENIQRCNYLR